MGGLVKSTVLDSGKIVRVEMGKVSFWSHEIPLTGESREVISENITVDHKSFTFCAATIGNPHCVIPLPEITPELAKQYGYLIETHHFFPNRINLQFMKAITNYQLPTFQNQSSFVDKH